jgi:hypothetical protein
LRAEKATWRGNQLLQPCAQPIDLAAAVLAMDAPLAEMFAVVGQGPVSLLPESRTRSRDHRVAIESRVDMSVNADGTSARELRERDFLDRPATPVTGQARIMDNPAVSHVNAVMQVSEATSDDVCREGRVGGSGRPPLALVGKMLVRHRTGLG